MNLLSALHTPDSGPWAARRHPEKNQDPRTSYQRDRDRILHCESFRKLQHKTQVLVVQEGDFFRTRLTHTLETAQIGRSLALMLGLTESLVEAICLGHDLGHSPFGHAGELQLRQLLEKYNLTWDSNEHSLEVVEDVEVQYCEYRGLNLTWATREGLARHKTKYDTPAAGGEYLRYRQPSLEAQVASISDLIAYSAHDVEDALLSDLLEIGELSRERIVIWEECYEAASQEFKNAYPEGWQGIPGEQLTVRTARRHLIDHLIRDVVAETESRVRRLEEKTLECARGTEEPIVALSPEIASQVDQLLDFMMQKVYRGPLVARQNFRAAYILRQLFEALQGERELLPTWVQARIHNGHDLPLEVARFLASLTDRSAADLYAELFEPEERAMGHRFL